MPAGPVLEAVRVFPQMVSGLMVVAEGTNDL